MSTREETFRRNTKWLASRICEHVESGEDERAAVLVEECADQAAFADGLDPIDNLNGTGYRARTAIGLWKRLAVNPHQVNSIPKTRSAIWKLVIEGMCADGSAKEACELGHFLLISRLTNPTTLIRSGYWGCSAEEREALLKCLRGRFEDTSPPTDKLCAVIRARPDRYDDEVLRVMVHAVARYAREDLETLLRHD